jgi:hypothetical protein
VFRDPDSPARGTARTAQDTVPRSRGCDPSVDRDESHRPTPTRRSADTSFSRAFRRIHLAAAPIGSGLNWRCHAAARSTVITDSPLVGLRDATDRQGFNLSADVVRQPRVDCVLTEHEPVPAVVRACVGVRVGPRPDLHASDPFVPIVAICHFRKSGYWPGPLK